MARVKKSRVNRSAGGDISLLLVVLLFAFLMVIPMYYAIIQSLKPLDELWIFPPRFWVANPTFKNFQDLFQNLNDSWVPFSRYIFNTLFVSIVGTFGHVIIASMAAYSLSKKRFMGSNFVFSIIVLSLMFTTAVTGIPTFMVMKNMHFIDTYWSIILPAFSSSLGLYLMKQHMEAMVKDAIIEAAKIDGAGEMRIFWTIVMPMVKPAWLTLIVFSFQGLWNATGATYIYSEDLKSLNYAVSQIVSAGIARAGTAAASIVFMMILPIAVFVFSQSSIVETMSSAGIKE
ncbi:MAG: carbohydrate ABC transporter permease [Clostridia bacterium]|nr:carbohydrate ABC transporter permease [Clostridia bacterium]